MKLHSLLTHSPRAALLGAITLVATAATGDAALITWGAAQNITGDSDVSTNGTLVDAFNVGTLSELSATVNGVTFAAFGVPLAVTPTVTVGNYTVSVSGGNLGSQVNFGSASAPFTSLSASYQSLLNQAAGAFPGSTLTLTMAGLTVGASYEFQWWANNSDVIGNPVAATAGNSVTLDVNVGNVAGSVGQYAIGTFLADSTSQQITFSVPGNSVFDLPFMNAFQLRNVTPVAAVPEPGTVLAGLVLAGFCSTLRRRRTV